MFGQLDKPAAQTVWRFNYMDTKITVKTTDIFAEPATQEADFPKEWLGKVRVAAPLTQTRTSHYYPSQRGGYADITVKNTYGYSRNQLEFARNAMAQSRGRHQRDSYSDLYGDESESDEFWGFSQSHDRDIYGALGIEEHDIRSSKHSLIEEEAEWGHVSDVTEMRGETLPGDDPDSDSFQAMVEEYGVGAADAFWDINNCMVDLEGNDDLLGSLAEEMCGMMKDDALKVELIRKLFEGLNSKAQSKLTSEGL